MSSELNHLVSMANQISLNAGIGASEDDAVARVADHIGRFWARPMRESIAGELDNIRDQLTPVAAKALEQIAAKL